MRMNSLSSEAEMERYRPAIGVDLDDVLMDFNTALAIYHNANYGTEYHLEDISDYDLTKLWNCTRDEAIRRVNEFYDTKEHLEALPIQGALEALKHLTKDFDLIVITARPDSISSITYNWIQRHFPGVFK